MAHTRRGSGGCPKASPRAGDNHLVTSVADTLRAESQADVQSLAPAQRIDLALRLGDDDVEVYRAARGVDRSAAWIELRRRRQDGRQRCRCLQDDPA